MMNQLKIASSGLSISQKDTIDSPDDDKGPIIRKYYNGKLLGKMLCSFHCDSSLNMGRFEHEVSELQNRKIIKGTSTSLLIPAKGMGYFKPIGFLLDLERCNVRGVFDGDAITKRVNSDGEKVFWSSVHKKFTVCRDNEIIESEFSGDYTSSQELSDTNMLDSIEELLELEASQSKLSSRGILFSMNEVVVDYDVSSIIGLLATTEFLSLDDESIKRKLVADCCLLNERMSQSFGMKYPIYLYDHKSGLLSMESSSGT